MKAIVYWISVMMMAAAVALAAVAAPVTFGFSPVIMDVVFIVGMSAVLAFALFSWWQFVRAARDEDDLDAH